MNWKSLRKGRRSGSHNLNNVVGHLRHLVMDGTHGKAVDRVSSSLNPSLGPGAQAWDNKEPRLQTHRLRTLVLAQACDIILFAENNRNAQTTLPEFNQRLSMC